MDVYTTGVSGPNASQGLPTSQLASPEPAPLALRPCLPEVPARLRVGARLHDQDTCLRRQALLYSARPLCVKTRLVMHYHKARDSSGSPSSSSLSCIHSSSTTSSSCGFEVREKWTVVDIRDSQSQLNVSVA